MAVFHGYNHDVFISFPGVQPQADWMRKLFVPTFRGELINAFPGWPPRIFFMNTEAQIGTPLAAAIKDALQTSCVLVPVLSYPYFQRPWCVAEWKSFMVPTLRHAAGDASLGRPRHIAPAIFAGDTRKYPPNGRSTGPGGLIYQSLTDFSPQRTPTKKFITAVRIIAAAVANMLEHEQHPPDPLWPAFDKQDVDTLALQKPLEAAQWMLVGPPVQTKPVLGGASGGAAA
jgi:TIR domain